MTKKTGGKRGRGQGALRKDGQPRESNTGTRKPVVDDSNWRVKAKGKHRIKFDDIAKQRYLTALAETGRKWFAEQAAGVARSTVESHLENDTEFADAFEDAVAAYSAPKIVQIEKDACEGQKIERFDPETGALIQVEHRFETRLRERFLERYEREYRQKSEIDLNARGGCVIIPGTVALSDWERAVNDHDRAQAKNHAPDAHQGSEGE